MFQRIIVFAAVMLLGITSAFSQKIAILKKNYVDSIRIVFEGERANSIQRARYLNSDTIKFKIIKIKRTGLTRIDTTAVTDLQLKSFSIAGALYTKNTKTGDHVDAEYRLTDLLLTGTPKQRLFNEFYATYGLTLINCDLIDESGKVYKLEDRRVDLKIQDGE